MKFISNCRDERPIRLSEVTRRFAYESLYGHKYGLDTRSVDCVHMDDVPGFAEMDDLEKYIAMENKIVREARIRICDSELVSGAATLGYAINHRIPARYKGEMIYYSVSHITPAFYNVIKYGTDWYRERIKAAMTPDRDKRQMAFLSGMLNTLDNLELWHSRYMDALREAALTDPRYEYNLKYLENVPMKPASDFREGVQSMWFIFAFCRLLGNWPGIGRIDEILGGLLERDLASGAITLEEARELLAHFMIKGCEWITGQADISGDAQHYQNIVLGGIDENGNEVTNHVTYLILDVVEELGISDFPIAVRLNANTPDLLIRRMAEVSRFGGGVIAAYNEGLVIDSMVKFGYSLKEARRFANDGCWEVQVPGKTNFSYRPYDSLQVLLSQTMKLDTDSPAHFDSYGELFAEFSRNLEATAVEYARSRICENFTEHNAENDTYTNWVNKPRDCSLISILTEGCIEKARSYIEGGPVYTVVSPHIGGAPDCANSLYALKKLVFDEKLVSYDEYVAALRANWDGYEALRRRALSLDYFGNDNDECDRILADVLLIHRDGAARANKLSPIMTPPGVSTFGRQIEWAPHRTASPHGRHAHDVLASNLSPTPGTDRLGATAVIRSNSKLRLEEMSCGAALDIKLSPSSAEGEDGIAAIAALYSGFSKLNGFFMQLDVIDNAILLKARANPEEYAALAVRVAGWSARFVTLSEEWQDMIIGRSVQVTAK